jgi:methanethiol S-methyltransferase
MRKRQHRAAAVTGVVSLLYAIHSLLAWNAAKALARRLLGPRYNQGVYRFCYSVQSLLSAAAALIWFVRQPDQELYRLRWPWSLLGRAVQVAGIAVLLDVMRVVGPLRLLGVRQALAALTSCVPPPPLEAQGPPLGPDGALEARGLFRHIRHPDNLPAVLLFFGFPRMTCNRLALAVTTLVYAVLGSLHEDQRLRRAYGCAFERYKRAVPFLMPRLRRRRGSRGTAAGRSVASVHQAQQG